MLSRFQLWDPYLSRLAAGSAAVVVSDVVGPADLGAETLLVDFRCLRSTGNDNGSSEENLRELHSEYERR